MAVRITKPTILNTGFSKWYGDRIKVERAAGPTYIRMFLRFPQRILSVYFFLNYGLANSSGNELIVCILIPL